MANPLLLLSGILMIVMGFAFVIYFKRRLKTPWKIFIYGGIIWLVSIILKGAMDVAVTFQLQNILLGMVGVAVTLTLMGVYFGLRTGLLESGLSYFMVTNSGIRKGFKDALSFGIGFGSAEAIFLGLTTTVNLLVLMTFPQIISSLPAATQEVINSQLSMSTLAVIPPILERLSVMAIHVFATVLLFLSARTGRMRYLWASIGFKAVTDGIIPWVSYLIDYSRLPDLFLAEVPFAILGVVALFGTLRMRKRFGKK